MKPNWRTIGDLVAASSVVLSLVFVAYELRTNRSIAINDNFAQSAEITTALNSYISDYADVWNKGCIGENLSLEEEQIYMKLVAAWDNYNFARYMRSQQGITPAPPQRWVSTVAMNMYRFPGFEKYWTMMSDSLAVPNRINRLQDTEGYRREIEDMLEEFRIIEPPNDFSAAVCGN